jgi:hypothetical protein
VEAVEQLVKKYRTISPLLGKARARATPHAVLPFA